MIPYRGKKLIISFLDTFSENDMERQLLIFHFFNYSLQKPCFPKILRIFLNGGSNELGFAIFGSFSHY